MTRPGSLARILCLLALLAGVGCRSGTASPPPDAGAGAGSSPPPAAAPGGDARREGDGWVWTAPPPAWVGLPAADDEAIAFTYGRQHLVVLDAQGRRQWQADRLGLRDVAPRLGTDLVVAATDDGLAAFRRAGGALLWDTPVKGRANTPVIAGGLAVTTTWEGTVVAINLADGRLAWTVSLPGPALGPPATDGTTVVAAWDRADRRSGGAIAVDAASGRQRWAVPLPGGGVSAPALTAGGLAVVVAGDLAAHALALTSGERKWRTEVEGAGSPEVPPLAVDARTVLVAHRLGGLDLLDAGTGRRSWQVATDGAAVRGGPVARPAGSYAFPLDDGRVLLAGPKRETELVRPPAGRVSGLAVGPGGWLVATLREAPVNTAEAGPLW
ncbi:MAG TPA: PQQ-binding-like beta-propeller repeat protein [Acidimicrobiales bacterium]|nr:PQQ-binding-like beta-propeller repeat protein [Acidimicrobiales bacterium]